LVLGTDHQAMDDQVTRRLDRSPGMIAKGIFDHPNIAEPLGAEHFVPETFPVAIPEPIRFPAMPQVGGLFVPTQAATEDIVSVGVDDFVIPHVVAPIGGNGYPVPQITGTAAGKHAERCGKSQTERRITEKPATSFCRPGSCRQETDQVAHQVYQMSLGDAWSPGEACLSRSAS
jgi:hypothetical protein